MNKKGFRILSEDDASGERYRKYCEHLQRFDWTLNPDLWRFFRKPFFHDGIMRDFKFSGNMSTFSFITSCMEIRHRSEALFQKHGWCAADFLCTFYTVRWFQLEDYEKDTAAFEGPELYFNDCEINTLIDEFEPDKKIHTCSSLIIALSDTRKHISIVFEDLDVWPLESAAFYQMLTSGQFIIPMYEDTDD